MAEVPIHFHQAFENLLVALDPHGAPSGTRTFPSDLSNDTTRIGADQSVIDWIQATYNATRHQHRFPVLERMAFVLDVSWDTVEGSLTVTKAHCQVAVVSGATIEEVVLGAEPKTANYFRVDYEPHNLGHFVFHDPFPHVHSEGKGEPRFALSISPSTPHVDFFELLLRNYQPDLWDRWAEEVWDKRVLPSLAHSAGAPRVLSAVRRAFAGNDFETLVGNLGDAVAKWRTAMQLEKCRMTSLQRDARCDAIHY